MITTRHRNHPHPQKSLTIQPLRAPVSGLVDWQSLNEKTREHHALQIVQDPGHTLCEVVFAGLHLKLSEIASALPSGGASSITLFADTVVVDVPSFDARGVVVMARSIDVSALMGGAMPVRVPGAGDMAVVQMMVQGTVGGPLALTTSAAPVGSPITPVPTGGSPLTVFSYLLGADGKSTVSAAVDAASIQDLVGRSWALVSLRAGYTAAAWLASSDDAAQRAEARSMLTWIVACLRVMGQGGATMPSDHAELYNQAAAVLVTLNVAPGSRFVPVLSGDFYKAQMTQLLGALQSYDDDLKSLNASTDLQKALQSVSATLASVADIERQPLESALESIRQSIVALNGSLGHLQLQFLIQQHDSDARFGVLRAKIQSEKAGQFLEAALTATLAPFKMAVQLAKVEEDPSAIAAAADTFQEAARKAYEALDAVTSDPAGDPELLTQARALLGMQMQLATSVQAGALLWANAQRGTTASDLPASLAIVTVDPTLAWSNYLVQVEVEVSAVKSEIGNGTGSGPAQAAADQYLASLKILAEYGKAMDAKLVTLAGQLARATVTKAQIVAAQSVAARWRSLESQAKSTEEKAAVMRSLLRGRVDALKRSLYAAWTHYRDAYFYLSFEAPPAAINLDMSVAQLKDTLAGVSLWIARALGDSPDGQVVRLPQDNVEVAFAFDVIAPGAAVDPARSFALLAPASGGNPATLTWTIPLGDAQLAGVLPSGGDVAIWIKEARFFLEGVKANAKGNVLVSVATSGAYQNSSGNGQAYSFVTKPLVGDYAYVAATSKVFNPWSIDAGVYMTPTPFTQWSLTFDPTGGDAGSVTRLQMELVVAYRRGTPAPLRQALPASAAVETRDRAFSLGKDWKALLGWFDRVTGLPADRGTFEERYGAFHDDAGVAAFVGAVAEAQDLARALGGPTALKAHLVADPDHLCRDTPPHALYDQIAWLAGQAGNAASTVGFTIGAIGALLDPAMGEATARAFSLKTALAGSGGVAATLTRLSREVEGVRGHHTAVIGRLSRLVRALTGTDVLGAANRVIGATQRTLAGREHRASGEATSTRLDAAREELARKQRLLADTRGLFLPLSRLVPAALDIDHQLRRIENASIDGGKRLNHLCSIASLDQLSDAAWVERALDDLGVPAVWRALETDARKYVKAALMAIEGTRA